MFLQSHSSFHLTWCFLVQLFFQTSQKFIKNSSAREPKKYKKIISPPYNTQTTKVSCCKKNSLRSLEICKPFRHVSYQSVFGCAFQLLKLGEITKKNAPCKRAPSRACNQAQEKHKKKPNNFKDQPACQVNSRNVKEIANEPQHAWSKSGIVRNKSGIVGNSREQVRNNRE